MKQLKFILATALAFLLCGSSCESCKETEPKVWTELPPATQTGANTIGCLVDGKLWATSKIWKGPFIRDFAATLYLYPDAPKLYITAAGINGSMKFHFVKPQLGDNKMVDVKAEFYFADECSLFEENNITGFYITKLDIEKGIVSGTFAFDLPCKDNKDNTAHITEGRFDMYMTVLGEENLKNEQL